MQDDKNRYGCFAASAWLIVLGGAVAIERLTGNALAASLPIAVHAGWKSLHSACWLKTADPNPHRGWACFWFYLATACWMAAACALVAIAVFAWMEKFLGQAMPLSVIAAELLILACSALLSAGVGLVAIVSAFRGRIRVWVHPAIREKCGGDFSRVAGISSLHPGSQGRLFHGFNHAVFIVGASLGLPLPLAGTVLMICRVAIVGPPPANGCDVTEIVGLSLILLAFPAGVLAYRFVSHRVIAQTPAECWPRNGDAASFLV